MLSTLLWLLLPTIAFGQQNVVTVYSEINYQGQSVNLSVGSEVYMAKPWNAFIGSVKVAKGFEFVAYQAHYQQYMIWDEDTPNLGTLYIRNVDNYVVRAQTFELSLNPQKAQKIAVLNNRTFVPLFLNLQADNIDASYGTIAQFWITPGYELILYDDFNQTGNYSQYTFDRRDLNISAKSYSLQKLPSPQLQYPSPTATFEPPSFIAQKSKRSNATRLTLS